MTETVKDMATPTKVESARTTAILMAIAAETALFAEKAAATENTTKVAATEMAAVTRMGTGRRTSF